MSGRAIGIIAATHVAALGTGYVIASRQPVDSVVKDGGIVRHDKTTVLSAVIESLREENRLAVFSYKGAVRIQADRSYLWLFSGHHDLLLPGVVTYYLDLSDLTLADVDYNEDAKLVTVKLPKLILGDVAMQPEQAISATSGILTWNEEQTEALRKMSFGAARLAFVAQAQQKGLVKAAERQAISNVEDLFAIPIRIAGMPDVKVVAKFK